MAEGGTKRQRRAELTADQLLEAARGVFETVGYQAATVGAITRAADTAHGTFYLYFRNKRDVFSRVVYQVAREMYEAGEDTRWDQDSLPPLESLRAGIRSFLEMFSAHRGLWRALLQGALEDPELESMWMELRRPFISRTERILERLHASGAIEPLDTETWATALSSMIEWVAFTHYVLGQAPPAPTGGPDPAMDRLVDGLARMWFRAVFTGADLPAFGASLS